MKQNNYKHREIRNNESIIEEKQINRSHKTASIFQKLKRIVIKGYYTVLKT